MSINFKFAQQFAGVQPETDNCFNEDDKRFMAMYYSVKEGKFNIYNYKTPAGEFLDIEFSECHARMVHDSRIVKQIQANMGPDLNDKTFVMTYDTYFGANPESGNRFCDDFTTLVKKLPQKTISYFDAVKYLLALHIPTATYKVTGANGRTTTKTLTDVTIDNIPFTYKGKKQVTTTHKQDRLKAFTNARTFINQVKKEAGVDLPYYSVVFDLFVGADYKNEYFENGAMKSTTYHNLGFQFNSGNDGYYDNEEYEAQSNRLMDLVDHEVTNADGTVETKQLMQVEVNKQEQLEYLNKVSMVTYNVKGIESVRETYSLTHDSSRTQNAIEHAVVVAEVVADDMLI